MIGPGVVHFEVAMAARVVGVLVWGKIIIVIESRGLVILLSQHILI